MTSITPDDTTSIGDDPRQKADAEEIGHMVADFDDRHCSLIEEGAEIGAKLIAKKLDLGPGRFRKWLKSNETVLGFGGKSRAGEFMAVARGTNTFKEIREATRKRVAEYRARLKDRVDAERQAEQDERIRKAKAKVKKNAAAVEKDAADLEEATKPDNVVRPDFKPEPTAPSKQPASSKIALVDYRNAVDAAAEKFFPLMTITHQQDALSYRPEKFKNKVA